MEVKSVLPPTLISFITLNTDEGWTVATRNYLLGVLATISLTLCFALVESAERTLGVTAWPTFGIAGSQRPGEVVAGEMLYLSLDITGLAAAKDGRVGLEIRAELLSPAGESVQSISPRAIATPQPFGGNSTRQFVYLYVPKEADEGKYTARVTIKDTHNGETVKSDLPISVSDPSRLSMLNVRLTRDKEGQQHSGSSFFCGEQAYVQLMICGYKKKDSAAKFVNKMTLLDADGKSLGTPPIDFTAAANDLPDNVPIRFAMGINRPGRFLIHLETEDKIGGEKVEKFLPIEGTSLAGQK
jgi:hypothetical protein